MSLALVQSTDALFEGQEGLVDFCSVYLGLFVLVDVISPSLIACQVDEANLGEEFLLVS